MTSPATVPLPDISPLRLLARRVAAITLRHIYLHIGSWPRFVEMIYWPIANMAMWGFMSLYVTKRLTHAEVVGSTLVAGVFLLECFLRPSVNTLMLFMEEIWSRNLGHLFSSPIRLSEYAAGLIMTALLRTCIALAPLFLLAKYLFGFSLLNLGWNLALFIPLLAVNGCIYGLMIVALLLRYGLAAEWLAWMATWLLLPFFAPYYDVSVLPYGLQLFAHALPPTYIFESMKSLIGNGELHPENLCIAAGLTAFYALAATFIFRRAYLSARNRGGLLQSGE